jgi:hypothetical protein
MNQVKEAFPTQGWQMNLIEAEFVQEPEAGWRYRYQVGHTCGHNTEQTVLVSLKPGVSAWADEARASQVAMGEIGDLGRGVCHDCFKSGAVPSRFGNPVETTETRQVFPVEFDTPEKKVNVELNPAVYFTDGLGQAIKAANEACHKAQQYIVEREDAKARVRLTEISFIVDEGVIIDVTFHKDGSASAIIFTSRLKHFELPSYLTHHPSEKLSDIYQYCLEIYEKHREELTR